MDSSNPKPPSKNDIELKEKRASTEVHAHQRTVLLSQMSNDELALALSWRETVG